MNSPPHEELTFRLSTRRNAVVAIALLFLAAGWKAGSFAVVAAGEALMVMLVLQWFRAKRLAPALSISRSHYPRTLEQSEVAVDLHLENSGRLPVYLAKASDYFPPGEETTVATLTGHLPGQSGVRFRYKQACSRRRGPYVLGPVRLSVPDELGLFFAERTVDELTTLLVCPQPLPLTRFSALGAGTHANIGQEILPFAGRSEEYRQLRLYRQGDPLRVVHWPTSMRLGAFFVKEFERSVVTELTLYCDLFLLSLSGIGDRTSVELRIKAAASIAADALAKQHRVRIVAAKAPVEKSPLGAGHSHLVMLLDWLALQRAKGEGSFEEVVIEDAASLRRGSSAVLIMSSTHVQPERLRYALRLLRLSGIRLLVVLVDDRTFYKLHPKQEKTYREALPLEELQGLLREEGATVYLLAQQDQVAERLGAPS